MDFLSLLAALALFTLLALGYHYIRHHRNPGESAPEHFFGGVDDETMAEPPTR